MGLGGEMFDTYKCLLPADVRKVALDELREDENIRDQSLVQMREWINKHPNIKKCRTDAPFLLRFLRTKKFSVPQACEMLERYLIIRQLYPNWFRNLDCEDKDLAEIVAAGYLVPMLERDHGKLVIFSCAGKFDPYKYTAAHMARVHSLITESLMDDELNQVHGYTYVNDEAGFQMAHISLWSLTDVRNMLRCIQNSTPMRHKFNHFLNISSNAVKLIEFAVSLLTEKLKSRIIIHKSMDELQKQMDPRILPKEYGGKIPLSDMIAKLQEKLKERREQVVALDEMYIEIDEKSCPLVTEMNEELGIGLEGSFKTLQVD